MRSLFALAFLFITIHTQAQSDPGSFGVECVATTPSGELRVHIMETVTKKPAEPMYASKVFVEYRDGRKYFKSTTVMDSSPKSVFSMPLPLARRHMIDVAEPDSESTFFWTRTQDKQTRIDISVVSDLMNADRLFVEGIVEGRFPEKMSVKLSADVYVPGLDEVKRINLTEAPMATQCKKVKVTP